jgi:hypothetical protein
MKYIQPIIFIFLFSFVAYGQSTEIPCNYTVDRSVVPASGGSIYTLKFLPPSVWVHLV